MARPALHAALAITLAGSPALAAHGQQAAPDSNQASDGYYNRGGLYIPGSPSGRSALFGKLASEATNLIRANDFTAASGANERAAEAAVTPQQRLYTDRLRVHIANALQDRASLIRALDILSKSEAADQREKDQAAEAMERLRELSQ